MIVSGKNDLLVMSVTMERERIEMRGREKAPLHKVRLATPIIRDGQGEGGRERGREEGRGRVRERERETDQLKK